MTLKLMIFWDYDTQWGADRSRLSGPHDWGHLEFENTERILDLHGQYDIPTCFAVVGAAARPGSRPYSDPDQIRRIHTAGHEIASHSLLHDWLPGLTQAQLLQSLRESKDTLEQCIGAPVVSFVPPYNQPFDYPQRGSFSLSERRGSSAGRERPDIPALCRALRETGYAFCRVSYLTPVERLQHLLNRKTGIRPSQPETIEGITCLRLNNAAGFRQKVLAALQAPGDGGDVGHRYVIAYGHPHSLTRGNAQDEQYYAPFLAQVQQLVAAGKLEVVLPRQLLQTESVTSR